MELNNLLQDSIRSRGSGGYRIGSGLKEKVEEAELQDIVSRLTISIGDIPLTLENSMGGMIDTKLRMDYKVEWPVNIIVSQASLTIYNQLFSFLLHIKHAKFSLDEIYRSCNEFKSAARISKFFTFLHEMKYFVNTLYYYVMNRVSVPSIDESVIPKAPILIGSLF